jgi:hypothetical protein
MQKEQRQTLAARYERNRDLDPPQLVWRKRRARLEQSRR